MGINKFFIINRVCFKIFLHFHTAMNISIRNQVTDKGLSISFSMTLKSEISLMMNLYLNKGEFAPLVPA